MSVIEFCGGSISATDIPTEKWNRQRKHTEPDLKYIHDKMQRKGLILALLWKEYKSDHPDGLMYPQVFGFKNDGSPNRKSFYGKTATEVLQKLHEFKNQADNGLDIDASEMTVDK